MDFWGKLEQSARKHNSLLCIGLDPYPERIPPSYGSIVAFNKAMIDATADIACAYKPNIAFYEALGKVGLEALHETMAYIPPDIPVILDAKRSDIASTAQAYAHAVFKVWGADAVTVNPYLGRDGVDPFLSYQDRGVFVLCKTSNASAGEVQDWSQGGMPLYLHIAELALTWANGREIGLVIGATYSEDIAALRARHRALWFLVPGVGAQGGDLEATLRAGLGSDGLGVLINASRAILYAADPHQAAMDLWQRINELREAISHAQQEAPPHGRHIILARCLQDAGCLQFGDFVLRSGARSPVYVDLRRLVTYPRALALVAQEYARLLAPLHFDRLAAIPYAALPIGTAISLQTGYPLIYPRREAKAYGTRRQIEGIYQKGERIVVLDDLISSGGSKLEAIAPLEAEGLEVQDIVVLIDREQGGREELADRGYRLQAAVTLRQIVDALASEGRLAADMAQQVHRYLDDRSR